MNENAALGLALISLFLFLFSFIIWSFWKLLRKTQRNFYFRRFSLPPGLYEKLMLRHPQLSLEDCQLARACGNSFSPTTAAATVR